MPSMDNCCCPTCCKHCKWGYPIISHLYNNGDAEQGHMCSLCHHLSICLGADCLGVCGCYETMYGSKVRKLSKV